MKRRHFLKNAALSSAGITIGSTIISCADTPTTASSTAASKTQTPKRPKVIATWNVGRAVSTAGEALVNGASVLDALEKGCRIEEADENNQTVGKGGRPDRDGNVTLDASIMDQHGNCGSVVYMQNITHAITVARKVMEDTPHVMLAGKGAEQFAVASGMPRENLLTEKSKQEWEKWLEEKQYKPIINIENHDTIGMLAIDEDGNLSGACTTSGLAYKMAGRVGDSPIIGSGLFVDNEIGAAVATGMGEEVVKTVGSFLIVELMRQGKSPQEACEEAIKRIVNKPNSNYKNFQVGYIAMNKNGDTGFYAIHEGFSMTQFEDQNTTNIKSDFYNKG